MPDRQVGKTTVQPLTPAWKISLCFIGKPFDCSRAQTHSLRHFDDGLRTDFSTHLRKITIAGLSQRFLQIQFSMPFRFFLADQFHTVNRCAAVADKRIFRTDDAAFQRRRSYGNLKHRPWRILSLNRFVDQFPAVRSQIAVHVVGIEHRRAGHRQYLTRFCLKHYRGAGYLLFTQDFFHLCLQSCIYSGYQSRRVQLLHIAGSRYAYAPDRIAETVSRHGKY